MSVYSRRSKTLKDPKIFVNGWYLLRRFAQSGAPEGRGCQVLSDRAHMSRRGSGVEALVSLPHRGPTNVWSVTRANRSNRIRGLEDWRLQECCDV